MLNNEAVAIIRFIAVLLDPYRVKPPPELDKRLYLIGYVYNLLKFILVIPFIMATNMTDQCEHKDQDLIWQVWLHIEETGECIICSLEEVKITKASMIYGPGFDINRYKFDEHKREMEILIMDSCVDAIPTKYIHFLKQLVNRQKIDTVLYSKPTGLGDKRSSLTLEVPGKDSSIPYSHLLEIEDVHPKLGWTEAIDECEHFDLICQVREHIEEDAECIFCSVEKLKITKAKELYGPGFDIIRYRFDEHKTQMEDLIIESGLDAIPTKYIHFLKQLVNRQKIDSVLYSKPTGVGDKRSSLSVVVPGK